MSAERVLENLVLYGKLREEYLEKTSEIIPSRLSQYQTLITVLLVIIAFASLSVTFLNRKGNPINYFASAAVASGSIALGSIYACNFFGVYI